MTARSRNIFISIILLISCGCIFLFISLFNYFTKKNLTDLGSDKIVISEKTIISSHGFINPVTIEKLKIDSIGPEQRPVKYEIVYIATCAIKQANRIPPVTLKKIALDKPGEYSWSEEKVNIPIYHMGLLRKRMDTVQSIIWANGTQRFDTCPIKFEPGNWYFVTFLDPEIVGVYIFVENDGSFRQFMTYSRVSPI